MYLQTSSASRILSHLCILCGIAGLIGSCTPTQQEAMDSTESTADTVLNLGKNAALSGCGGFTSETESQRNALSEDAKADGAVDQDCSEELLWTYDSSTSTITFLHHNSRLNCCGEHSIVVTTAGTAGAYEIAVNDALGDEGRCRCMCQYDFKVDLPEVSGTIQVKLTLTVEDELAEPAVTTRWEGQIDLGSGSGTEVIGQRSGDACF